MNILSQELAQLPANLFVNKADKKDFLQKIREGGLTRYDNPQSHCCVFFLPFNRVTNEIFLVHHKKANTWLSPGGHIDLGETLSQTLVREMREELGLVLTDSPQPFLVTIKSLAPSKATSCAKHYDIWHVIDVKPQDLIPDMKEFHYAQWFTQEDALVILTDDNTRYAVELLRHSVLK